MKCRMCLAQIVLLQFFLFVTEYLLSMPCVGRSIGRKWYCVKFDLIFHFFLYFFPFYICCKEILLTGMLLPIAAGNIKSFLLVLAVNSKLGIDEQFLGRCGLVGCVN